MMHAITIEKNVIQAPMAGVTTPKFVAACCEAGVLGFIGAGYLNGTQTQEQIQQLKQLTNRPFGVNLFVQEEPQIDIHVLQEARMALQPIYEELNIQQTATVTSTEVFQAQIDAVLAEKVAVVSFTFGLPDAAVMEKLHANGSYLIGTATTLEEALAVEAHGFDAVVLQGSEAGGHRGSFLEPMQLIPIRPLLQSVKEKLQIPIIAAGGIMNKQHADEMYALGASYVQIGTALLTAEECEVSALHKEAILQSKEAETVITKAFTGKAARGLKNDFTERLQDAVVAPYPLQHHLTLPIRQLSAKTNRPQYLSLWMGENSHLAEKNTVKNILAQL